MGGMGGGGGEGGSKKDKGKDSEINADISTMEIDEVSAQARLGSSCVHA